MDLGVMLVEVESEIAKLTDIRDVLRRSRDSPHQASAHSGAIRRGPGRKPNAIVSAINSVGNEDTAPAKKRVGMSPEGRARIQAALKKRWADKKAADAMAESGLGPKPAKKSAKKAVQE